MWPTFSLISYLTLPGNSQIIIIIPNDTSLQRNITKFTKYMHISLPPYNSINNQQPTNNHIQTLQIIFAQPYHSMQAARLLQFTVLSPISK
jgi:hypothetical protein